MEVKTKYNENDEIYFLTTNSEYAHKAFDTYLKKGEVFACKAVVRKMDVKIEHNIVNVYVTVQTMVSDSWVEMHEKFCAPDIMQLGTDVTNRYRVAEPKPKKKK